MFFGRRSDDEAIEQSTSPGAASQDDGADTGFVGWASLQGDGRPPVQKYKFGCAAQESSGEEFIGEFFGIAEGARRDQVSASETAVTVQSKRVKRL